MQKTYVEIIVVEGLHNTTTTYTSSAKNSSVKKIRDILFSNKAIDTSEIFFLTENLVV